MFSHIWSASINSFGSDGSDRGIVDNGDHNIAIDTLFENASISTSSFLSSCFQTLHFLNLQAKRNHSNLCNLSKAKRSTAKPTYYAQLNNPWSQRLRDSTQAEAINEPKRGFAVRACKINVGSDLPQTYQEAVQCCEKRSVDRSFERGI